MANKRGYWAFAALVAVGILAVAGPPAQSSDKEDDKQVLQGSFLVTIMPATGGANIALETFTHDGQVIVSFFNPVLGLVIGQGTWVKTRDGEFATTFLGLSKPGTGPAFVAGKTQDQISLDASGDSFTGRFKATFFDASGNVVRIGTGTIRGARIVGEPLETDPPDD